MSYQQLIVAWSGAPVGHRCVNPYDPEADYPEHREDEAWERDPLFERHPDDVGAHPLAPLDRQLFQDGRTVQGKVVGRHEAVVRTPWYLTSQYLGRTLGCPVAQAAQRADSFALLDADAAMVDTFLGWVKAHGLEAGLTYFSQLATAAAEAESVDPADALHQATASYQDWEHDRAAAERDDALAALPDLAWTPMGDERAAVDAWLGRHADDPDRDQAVGVDLSAAITEGWHLLDEPDEAPTWLARQPARYQVLLQQVETATDLDQLKRLGQKGYAATWFTRAQRQVFWSSWAVRKGAILGGVLGHVWGQWLPITILWLAAPVRGQGYGRQLLSAAEACARARGCRHVKLETFSFQARPFHEKLGYEVSATLEDCPPGHRDYCLRKPLPAKGEP